MMPARYFQNLIRPLILNRDNNLPEEIKKPGEQQREAEKVFSRLVRESNLRLWKPGYTIPTDRVRFLIGVGLWSLQDLRLLDTLNDVLGAGHIRDDLIDVFNFWAECKNEEDLSRFIPDMNIKRVFHTPVVGKWENGVLVASASGAEGRKMIIKHYQIPF